LQNVTQWADSTIPEAAANIFEALIGAIFFDSNYSLKVVWDVNVIDLLLRQYTGKSI
jgi:dsRNA-specific ribonuclease